jgi:hypothetical protein
MGSSELVVEVHYGGRFDRRFGCVYVGGEVEVHHEKVDLDKLLYFEIEGICKEYGYRSGDLINFKDPRKSLVDGLYLITSDHDVLSLSACHNVHVILELYIVSFENKGGDEENSEEDDEYGGRVNFDDPWWADKLSDDEDLFDVDVGVGAGAVPSNVQLDNHRVESSEESSKDGIDNDSEDDGDHTEAGQMTYEDVDDDYNSDMGRSDILVSPVPSDEECEITLALGSEFHLVDMRDPVLELEMKFSNIRTFREAVRMFNFKRGKDITFKRNKKQKCIVVCKEPNCNYRVYARKLPDEETFQIRSMQSEHLCCKQFKNSIVTSTWIADKLIDKFRVQLDMPLGVIQHEVKERWRVDVNPSMMYRARTKANRKIFGKHELQYVKLWDYCETLRSTNPGSCVVMKVNRLVPEVNPKFLRMYCSLVAMKKGILEGCRPVIGVDGCFLKGPFKGQLLAAVE